MAMLISNVLRKNSAYDHQTLATRIQDIIDKAHPAPEPMPVEPTPAAGGAPGNGQN